MQVLRNNELVDLTPAEEAAFLAERAERSRITPEMVKAEASRRIYARYPAWKQANMLALGQEFDRVRGGNMRDENGNRPVARDLTPAESAEELALARAWAWIKAVRQAEGVLSASNPIPSDYRDDARWPA